MTREDVVQAALTVARWCKNQCAFEGLCDCPFADIELGPACVLMHRNEPKDWELEKFLRTRGMKHETE